MDNRIFLAEPDLIRTLYENRVRRSFWASYILLATVGFGFLIAYLWRVA